MAIYEIKCINIYKASSETKFKSFFSKTNKKKHYYYYYYYVYISIIFLLQTQVDDSIKIVK